MRIFFTFRVPWKNSGIDTEWPEHDSYLSDFQDVATSTIQSLINKSIEQRPEINAKTKQTQVIKGVVLCQTENMSSISCHIAIKGPTKIVFNIFNVKKF